MTDLRALLASSSPAQVEAALAGLSAVELEALRYDWVGLWARAEQVPDDGDAAWSVFLYLAGRGAGKTRAGAEWIRKQAREHPGCRIALVARTAADVRDTMVEGNAGLLAVCPENERPTYLPSVRRLVWPNGSVATTFAAQDGGDQLRGPSHHYSWADEACAWPDLESVWASLVMTMRLGTRPRIFVSTTPRPSKWLRSLMSQPSTVVRRGSTFSNAANLPPAALSGSPREV